MAFTLPPLSLTGGSAGPSNAAGGYTSWERGDLVVNYGDGGSATGAAPALGAGPLGIGWGVWALAGAVVAGVLVWKRSR